MASEPAREGHTADDPLVINGFAEVQRSLTLPESEWMVISAPVAGLQCDEAFTARLDSDGDGRIRADELRGTIEWLARVLGDHTGIEAASEELVLAHLCDTDSDGRALLQSARQALEHLGRPDAGAVNLADVREFEQFYAGAVANGDGVVVPATMEDCDVRQFAEDVMASMGAMRDKSGADGIASAQVDGFCTQIDEYLAWLDDSGAGSAASDKEGANDTAASGSETSDRMVWGEDTPEAYALYDAVRAKVDEYFRRCRLLALDERAEAAMQVDVEELAGVDLDSSAAVDMLAERIALAPPNRDEILHLDQPINPRYRAAFLAMKRGVLDRLLGRDTETLSSDDWRAVRELFRPYQKWAEHKQSFAVDAIDTDRLRRYHDSEYADQVRGLIAEDLAVATDVAALDKLLWLILCQRWILTLARSFITFDSLYDPDVTPLFQMGTLVLGGRELTFTVLVEDIAQHKRIAELSGMYVLYVEITRSDTPAGKTVAALLTSGRVENLHIGRRGLFRTNDGRQWDARIVDRIVNPITYWDAVKQPLSRLGGLADNRLVRANVGEDQVESSAGKSVTDRLSSKATGAVSAHVSKFSASAMRDLMLTGSVSLAAVMSAFAFATKSLAQVTGWQLFLALSLAIVAIATPFFLLGAIKQRRQNISFILEASGWALSSHQRLVGGAGQFSQRASDDTKGIASDMAALGKRALQSALRVRVLLLLLVVSIAVSLFFFFGLHDRLGG